MSLATDAATEAIYPLLPFFLTHVLGAGPVSLGLVEGAADAVNSALKVASGRIADRSRAKRPLVLFGYGLSSAVRPMMALAQSWAHVFAIRIVDRIGKGVRGAPRDAMLAGWATPATRGQVYGFHRAMDHAGAIIGPLAATLFLYFNPGEYRTLFALTIVPGAIAVVLIFFVKEDGVGPEARAAGVARVAEPVASDSRQRSNALPSEFTRFMLVLTLFTLGNSTDAFLILRLTESAGGVEYVPLMWAALHVVKATVSVYGGAWSDRVGRRAVIATGWIIYAVVYAGFAVSTSIGPLLVLFLAYGCYFGFAEGAEKALVADLAPAARRGFAFGLYNAVLGLGALGASVIFGALWAVFGPAAAFATGAIIALVSTGLLFAVVRR